MSADNAYCVWQKKDGMWAVDHVFMSPFGEDCLYLKDRGCQVQFSTRAQALVEAHNRVQKEYIVEYGVIESVIPDKPCGTCWTCIHKRR